MCGRKYNEKIDEMDIQQYIISKQTNLSEEFVAIMDEALTDFDKGVQLTARKSIISRLHSSYL